MKKGFRKYIGMSLVLIMLLSTTAFANEADYGAKGVIEKETFTIEEMLNYAIQDEYLAKAEYEKIIDEYGEQRPFTNIVKAEEYHIYLLKPLFEEYDIELPKNNANEYVVVPKSIEEALEVGVQAEIDNISMYEKFLMQELPTDIEDVFERLKNASENHLIAFERGTERGNVQGSYGFGRGNDRGNKRSNCGFERRADGENTNNSYGFGMRK